MRDTQDVSTKITCETCLWFTTDDKSLAEIFFDESQEENNGVGRCHRCPPTTKGFPVVSVIDWCGEFDRKL